MEPITPESFASFDCVSVALVDTESSLVGATAAFVAESAGSDPIEVLAETHDVVADCFGPTSPEVRCSVGCFCGKGGGAAVGGNDWRWRGGVSWVGGTGV